jgi:hypothetical protein
MAISIHELTVREYKVSAGGNKFLPIDFKIPCI